MIGTSLVKELNYSFPNYPLYSTYKTSEKLWLSEKFNEYKKGKLGKKWVNLYMQQESLGSENWFLCKINIMGESVFVTRVTRV